MDALAAIDSCGDILLTGDVGAGYGEGYMAIRLIRDGVIKVQQNISPSIGMRPNAIGPAPRGIFVLGATGDNLQGGS
jgi:hypothetical protein